MKLKTVGFPGLVRLSLLMFLFTLVGCTTHEQNGMVEAATAPLSDLNLVRAGIPEVLVDARRDPYALPDEVDCASLDSAVLSLDEVLPPDHGVEQGKEGGNHVVKKGQKTVSAAAVDALRRTTEGVVPFRGWVRKLSGAERRSAEVSESIAAGLIRRAYLKGYMAALNCD